MPQTTFEPLSIDERAALRELVRRHGMAGVARRIGLGREALARIIGALPARLGSYALVRAALTRGNK